MATRGAENANGDQEDQPAANALALAGVHTGEDFARLMSALMSDVVLGKIPPDISNAAVNAGGKLLKVVEMQYRYGSKAESRASRPFMLTGPAQEK